MIRKLFCFNQTAFVAALLYCSATLSPIYANLIAYEGFNYAPGSLGGLNSGTGWGGAWSAGGGASAVVSGGLTYTDTNGNELVVSGNHARSSGQTGSANPGRFLASAQNTAGTTTWLSFIAQRLSPHPTPEENLARVASLQTWMGTGSERLAIGKHTTPISGTVEQNWGFYPHNQPGSNGVFTTTPHLDQAFLVVRIDHQGGAGSDLASLWVNPMLGIDPGASSYQLINPFDLSFDRIALFVGNSMTSGPWAEFIFDEIRVGTTYASVAPIFDPNALRSDFNGDTFVNLDDFDDLRENFLTGSTHAQGDANFDGVVNHQDFFIWRTDYLAGGGNLSDFSFSFAVPEPSTGFAALVMALCAGNLFARGRNDP